MSKTSARIFSLQKTITKLNSNSYMQKKRDSSSFQAEKKRCLNIAWAVRSSERSFGAKLVHTFPGPQKDCSVLIPNQFARFVCASASVLFCLTRNLLNFRHSIHESLSLHGLLLGLFVFVRLDARIHSASERTNETISVTGSSLPNQKEEGKHSFSILQIFWLWWNINDAHKEKARQPNVWN